MFMRRSYQLLNINFGFCLHELSNGSILFAKKLFRRCRQFGKVVCSLSVRVSTSTASSSMLLYRYIPKVMRSVWGSMISSSSYNPGGGGMHTCSPSLVTFYGDILAFIVSIPNTIDIWWHSSNNDSEDRIPYWYDQERCIMTALIFRDSQYSG